MNNKPSITAQYVSTRFDLQDGREWLVTTSDHADGDHLYIVTVWQEDELGRMASCRCKAASCGLLCRHVRYAQVCDSILTHVPMRAIRPVYEGQVEECATCEGEHDAELPCVAMSATAEDRMLARA
jgi:hypothetical protein